MCQRIKNCIEILAEKLIVNKILKKLWTHLTVYFITKLPLVARKDAILVVYDTLSKTVYFVAMTKKTSVKGLVWLFRNNI